MAKIVKTAKLKITSHTSIFDETIEKYRDAVCYLMEVILAEKDSVLHCEEKNGEIKVVETLIHATKHREDVPYDFDEKFYKFPSYLRRSAIMEAAGAVRSHLSNTENWKQAKAQAKEDGKPFYKKEPGWQPESKGFPTFYKDGNWKPVAEGISQIKIFKDDDWKWIVVNYNTKNLFSSGKSRFDGMKQKSPSLVKNGKKYFLVFPYIGSSKLSKKADIVVGVDLGLTNSAVCSTLKEDGTVVDRLFINQSTEKDRLRKARNKLKKAWRNSGDNEKPNLLRKQRNLQKFVVQDTVNQIVSFAVRSKADVIVMEHLGGLKARKGSGNKFLRNALHHWGKMEIQKLVEQKAHSLGIRISRVSANGTSKYAFDGSGAVKRSTRKDLCEFSTGKQYHSDLSASYNIAARFFLRNILNPLDESERLIVEAKVPLLSARSTHTLATLIRLREVV